MAVKLAIIKLFACLSLVTLAALNNCHSQEASVQPKGVYSSNFNINGIPRNINFYIPYGYHKRDSYPVVFVLHAEGETGKTVIKKYGDEIQQLADSSDCIVVYPDAVKGHWNSGFGTPAATDTINDAGFMAIMLNYFVQQYNADPLRIYATGFYSGGNMAWRLGCYLPNKIAAVAPFVASVQALAKTCLPGAYFNADSFMPQPGNRFSNGALQAAWKFLMNNNKAVTQ